MKPQCEPCGQQQPKGNENLSSVIGKETAENLVYKIFEMDALNDNNGVIKKFYINQLIQSYMKANENKYSESELNKCLKWMNIDWDTIQKFLQQKKLWQNLVEKIKKGDIAPSQLSPDKLLENFLVEILDGMSKEGYIELKNSVYHMHVPHNVSNLEFSARSEKIIAKKVLEETFINLKKHGIGIHEVKEEGFGNSPSYVLREYDDFQHSYDALDIQETLLCTAIRDPKDMQIIEEDLKARVPSHMAKSSNIILIDSSYSMRGNKFKGGIMAALALRELLQADYKEDSLHIVAYNHKPKLLAPGEILKLRPYGYTDIGQAIDYSAEILSKEDGNRNVFLITDGEPTSTQFSNLNPEQSALRAAYDAGKQDVNLNIIMLDQRAELKLICEKMARINRNSTLTYVKDPCNLKEFIIKSFINLKGSKI